MLTGGPQFQLAHCSWLGGDRWRHREAGEQHLLARVGLAERCRGGGVAAVALVRAGAPMGRASGFRRGHGHAVAAVVFSGGSLLASRLMSLRGQAECLAERGHEREGEEDPATAAFCACVGILGAHGAE